MQGNASSGNLAFWAMNMDKAGPFSAFSLACLALSVYLFDRRSGTPARVREGCNPPCLIDIQTQTFFLPVFAHAPA